MTAARAGATAVVTLCSSARVGHVRNQLVALRHQRDVARIVVWMTDEDPPALEAESVLRVPPGANGWRLGAARNAGASAARAAGADLLVFLDADCVPGPDLIAGYRAASSSHPDAVLSGPVTYLPAGVDVTDPGTLAAATAPHPSRPDPPPGRTRVATSAEYALFWSLSFAATGRTWERTQGFDEGYEGYGGEDTDFGFSLRRAGIPLVWVGGAHAYHQHHATSTPPWRHLDDILRNGARFAARWGEWPMTGWLEAFAEAGAVMWDGSAWRRTGSGRASGPSCGG
jgi:N-acetylglucosaminyl-diphospho-decaprenol L-rhamnosyltransferase